MADGGVDGGWMVGGWMNAVTDQRPGLETDTQMKV